MCRSSIIINPKKTQEIIDGLSLTYNQLNICVHGAAPLSSIILHLCTKIIGKFYVNSKYIFLDTIQ